MAELSNHGKKSYKDKAVPPLNILITAFNGAKITFHPLGRAARSAGSFLSIAAAEAAKLLMMDCGQMNSIGF